MAKPVFYRQCRLTRPYEGGETILVSWIPDQFAVAGKVVKLHSNGQWEEGWIVRSVGGNRLAAADVPDFHELSKAHLRATGDAETA